MRSARRDRAPHLLDGASAGAEQLCEGLRLLVFAEGGKGGQQVRVERDAEVFLFGGRADSATLERAGMGRVHARVARPCCRRRPSGPAAWRAARRGAGGCTSRPRSTKRCSTSPGHMLPIGFRANTAGRAARRRGAVAAGRERGLELAALAPGLGAPTWCGQLQGAGEWQHVGSSPCRRPVDTDAADAHPAADRRRQDRNTAGDLCLLGRPPHQVFAKPLGATRRPQPCRGRRRVGGPRWGMTPFLAAAGRVAGPRRAGGVEALVLTLACTYVLLMCAAFTAVRTDYAIAYARARRRAVGRVFVTREYSRRLLVFNPLARASHWPPWWLRRNLKRFQSPT